MIDTEQLCPKCMKPWTYPAQPCPHCGFSGADEVTGEKWEDFSIVEGRYLVGTAIARDGSGLAYIAMDLAEEKNVTLRPRAEGFAVGEYAQAQPRSEPEAPNENGDKKRSRLLPMTAASPSLKL